MKNYIFLPIFLCALFFSNSAFSQPANDACAGATTLPQDGSCIGGTTVGATDGLAGSAACAGNNDEVWYTFTATGTNSTIDVTNGTQGGDVEVVILSATSPCNGLFVQGSGCGASPLTVSTNNLQPGTIYYVLLSSTGTNGTFTICNEVTTPPPAPGLDCGAAAPLCNDDSFSQGTFTGIGIAEEISQNSCFGGDERQAKWYTFTADQSGTFEFANTPATLSDDYDWALWETTGGCYTSATTMGAPISCNWSGCAGATGISADPSTIPGANNANGGGPGGCGGTYSAFDTSPPTLTAGETYTLLIDNFSSSGGGFSMDFGGDAVMGPNAEFLANFSGDCLTLNTNRSPHYTGSNMTYTWSFGDGSTSTAAQPSHTYAASGNYFVTLTVTDANGCSDTYSLEINGCIVLPVELMDFTVIKEERYNLVEWTTASELNSDYFEVEHSINGKDWNIIGKVDGAGTTNSKQNYSMTHFDYSESINYYRLTQVDFDGKRETFNIISIDNLSEVQLLKRVNTLGQEVDENYSGVVIEFYSDGTTKKIYK